MCGEGATSPAQKTVTLSGVHGWAPLLPPGYRPHRTQGPLASPQFADKDREAQDLPEVTRSQRAEGAQVGRSLGVS